MLTCVGRRQLGASDKQVSPAWLLDSGLKYGDLTSGRAPRRGSWVAPSRYWVCASCRSS